MKKGKVKWFDATKGYGFIVPDDGGSDVFVHISSVEKAGLEKLDNGQAVGFDTSSKNGRVAATKISLVA